MSKGLIQQLAAGFRDIIYPKKCASCNTPLKDTLAVDELVCTRCWAGIKRNIPPFCSCCGRHLERKAIGKNTCPLCVRARFHFDRAFSPVIYDGAAKELIHAFKYRGKDYLGKPLSKLLISFIKEYSLPMQYVDYLIPIPLHQARLREREFNQAHILAEAIAKEFNKTVASKVLLRHRATVSQTELEPSKRFSNVQGSFTTAPKAPLSGKNIMLVDDVLTTGATCSEAARALKDAGAGVVFALTIAN